MSNLLHNSNITSSLQKKSNEQAKELVEEMENQKREAFENMLKHSKESMKINKFTAISKLSAMIVNN